MPYPQPRVEILDFVYQLLISFIIARTWPIASGVFLRFISRNLAHLCETHDLFLNPLLIAGCTNSDSPYNVTMPHIAAHVKIQQWEDTVQQPGVIDPEPY